MQTTHATRTVHASPERVWAQLADVTAITNWHPSVKVADLLSPSPRGVGAARRCNFHDGTSVREEVIDVQEGRSVRLRMSEYSVPMNRLEVEFTLAPTADGHTETSFALFYEVKYGPFGRLLGATVMRRELSKMAARVLAGLDHHVTTGEQVGPDFVAA